jgi:hypothetical protein
MVLVSSHRQSMSQFVAHSVGLIWRCIAPAAPSRRLRAGPSHTAQGADFNRCVRPLPTHRLSRHMKEEIEGLYRVMIAIIRRISCCIAIKSQARFRQ